MADLSLLLEFYENLVKSRRFDEMLWDAYVNGKPLGMTHLGIGEEAVGTATMKAFRDTDIVCPHHRSHAHILMRGCDMRSMLSETRGLHRDRSECVQTRLRLRSVPSRSV